MHERKSSGAADVAVTSITPDIVSVPFLKSTHTRHLHRAVPGSEMGAIAVDLAIVTDAAGSRFDDLSFPSTGSAGPTRSLVIS